MRAYLALAIAIVSLAGCNDDQQPQPRPERQTNLPSRRAEPPKPEPDRQPIAKVDVSLGNGFEMRHPIKDGRLTLIPIVATQATPTTKFITLHDGMQRNLVSVRELGEDWEVDTVRITNRSKDTLVALSGELIVDAMQDRVLAEDTVITAGKTELVHVRCVEEDRDHGGSTFHAGNAMAELALRRTVVHASQEMVWAKVKQINRAQKLAPPTNTYRLAAHNQAKGAAGERRDRIVAQLEALEERQQIVGLAVAIDGQVVAIQRLATPELYRQLEGELLASYMPDTDGVTPEGKRLSPDDVRALQAAERGASTAASHSVLRAL